MKNIKKYLFSYSVFLLSWQLAGCSGSGNAGTEGPVIALDDTEGPVITLNGNANIEVVFNAFFDDIGAQAVDDIDGEVPVTLEGTVDTSIPGTYELTYMAADSSGNTSELVRVVEVLSDPLLEASVSIPAPPIAFFFDGTLIGADYWSQEPQILSGGVGFADILGVEADEVTEGLAREVGGTWSSDISCGNGQGNYTTVATQDQISRGYIQQVPYGELKDGALGIDGLPIVFSWPVDTRTISLTDFQFTLNTGDIVRPLAASPIPNHEDNERNTVVVFGEFANRLPSDDANARYPIRLRIVQDNTPLMLVGPNNQLVSAVGMTWETSTSPYDENNGPKLVGAKLNRLEGSMRGESVSGITNPLIRQLAVPANDASVLYGEGDFMLRMLTTGGFSPDGVSGVKPTDFERFFRIHVMGEEGNNVIIDKLNQDFNVKDGTLRVVGLSDLGQPEGGTVAFDECYGEDRDNYIDIILVGDEDAARSITHLEIPSLDGGYSAFYNPGGPGRTPFEGVVYTSPGPADLEPVIIALDDPMRIDYTPTVDTSQEESGQFDGIDNPDAIVAEDGDRDIGANESIPRCVSYYDDEMTAQAPNAAKWCREGAVMSWQSADWPSPIELFYHCEGEPSDPAIYLQHGWPTSSFDFQELSAELSSDHYVCSLDTPGYGFSDKPDGYPYSILEDGEIVQVFIEDIMAVDELLLLTHDKGDSVGLELLHRYNSGLTSFEINRFLLLNGSIHLAEANISDAQTRLLSADTGPQTALGLDASILAAGLGLRTFSPPLTAAGIGELASVFDFDEGTRVLHQTIQYLEERRVYEDTRWLRALADSVVPTTLIWGELDPVAVPAVADYVWDEVLSTRLAPAEYFRVPCANHYIQNDRAQDVLAIVRGGALPAHQDSHCEQTYLFRSTLGDTQ